jgi:uncharacterized protein (DUF2141 family)
MKSFLLPLLIGACLLVMPQWAWAQPSNSSNPQVLCFGAEEPYCVDCTENGNTGTAGSTYTWTVSAASATILPNPAFPAVQANPLEGNHIIIDWGTTPVGNYTVQVLETNADGCSGDPVTLNVQIQQVTAIASTPVDPTCGASNGSITLGAVTGGTGPYTYSFNGSGFTATTSYTGLAAGSYTVIVRDANGCEFTAPAIALVDQAGPTALVTTVVDATCDGASTGSITLGAVSGGNAPYTYSFNGSGFTATTSYTGLAAGNYTIVVRDANGCEYTTTATIAEPLPFTVDVTAGPQICFEGSAIFTFSGGPANGTVNITVDGVAQTITLDGSGAFSLIVDNATADVDVDVINVSDGTCTYDVTDSGTVIVSPEITTSPISHD